MAMTDAIRQSELLPSMKPSIGFLDIDKIKNESSVYTQRRPVSTALNMPIPPLISPSNMYSGPPPPYSYPSPATSSVISHGGFISPTESRPKMTIVDDEKEPPSSHRHSLPSIHEALANESPLSITSLLSKPTPQTTSQSNQNHSSANVIPRSYPEGPPRAPLSVANQHPTSTYHPHDCSEKPAPPPFSPRSASDSKPSRFSAVNTNNTHDSHYPPLQPSRTVPSPTDPLRPSQPIQHQHASPVYERFQRPALPMNSHPYNTCHAAYSYPPPSASIPSYQTPHLQPSNWRSNGSEIDRVDEARRTASKGSPPAGQAYGESVKRHLDIFDLETSLNEIAEGSRLATDFASAYGIRAYQTQRSGVTAESLPGIQECDEMITRQTRVLDSMTRIREVLVAQKIALAEQQNQERRYKATPSEFDDDAASYQDKMEGAGGFAGPDSKKRRGRAAPPGRCHSCNRAETPEWRRGPDGARTLCNACGLHYAKLTRKMSSKGSSSNSNIRPKEMTASSPQ